MQHKSNPDKVTNRLIKEKSPYLQQHAYNPVDWYPWTPEAFEKAKAEDKPVFVSIGYSSCHWCHVMEKECFDNQQVAELMNQAFVCIKVDREERPDLDAAYMAACQAMGRNCGWPLNVIMTPDKNPFFIASYIPKDNRYGSLGMLSLIPQIADAWKKRRLELESVGLEIKEQIGAQNYEVETLGAGVLDDAYGQLLLRFDRDNGGFGSAPKFPSPHNLLFLLRYYSRTKEKSAWIMVEKTLRVMRLGGIFDQAGFGFHRYSTDAQWLVPHFEKMLYDQALLALAYTEAYHASGAGKFKVTSKETLDYVLRDLTGEEGGFLCAEDADSEGEEGKFYLWTQKEIEAALPSNDAQLAIKLLGITPKGNFVEPLKGTTGKNILYLPKPIDQAASELNLTSDELIFKLEKIRRTLFEARKARVHPSKDDKVLLDWNGLMIAALARASAVLGDKKYLQAASNAADFLLKTMRRGDGLLFHRYAKGETAIDGFLDDYAYLALGLSELYLATFNEEYLEAAVELTKKALELFWDEENGGFFFTAKNSQDVPRLKQTYDGAMPSGNSVALLNLLRLSRLRLEETFESYAKRLLEAFSGEIALNPVAHTFMLVGLEFALGPAYSVVLVGDLSSQDTKAMVEALRKHYVPNLTVTHWTQRRAKSAPIGVTYEQIDGKATAYVCRDRTCMPPTNDPQRMLELLQTPSEDDLK